MIPRPPERAPTVLALVLLSIGCLETTSRDEEASRADPVDSTEVERLRSLGYVSTAPALPPDAKVGVLSSDPSRWQPGVNFFANAHFCSAQLMDMNGKILRAWSYEPCFRWGNALLTSEGDVLVMGRKPHEDDPESARRAHYLVRMDWDGEVVWEKQITAHHDVDVRRDGTILTLMYELRLIPERHESVPVRDDKVVVLDSEGEVIEEQSLWDLLQNHPELVTLRRGRVNRYEGAQEIDMFHSNTVEWLRYPELVGTQPFYRQSSILLCIRNQNTLAILDWDSKELLWAWGQGHLRGPHDATVLPSGNILVFDNGRGGRGWSRVLEVDPSNGEIVWEYRAEDPQSFYTGTRGSSQRLSNGNTLIVESSTGTAFEVTPDGETVWEFLNSNITEKREPSVIVRMRRYDGVDYDDLARRITSGTGFDRVD